MQYGGPGGYSEWRTCCYSDNKSGFGQQKCGSRDCKNYEIDFKVGCIKDATYKKAKKQGYSETTACSLSGGWKSAHAAAFTNKPTTITLCNVDAKTCGEDWNVGYHNAKDMQYGGPGGYSQYRTCCYSDTKSGFKTQKCGSRDCKNYEIDFKVGCTKDATYNEAKKQGYSETTACSLSGGWESRRGLEEEENESEEKEAVAENQQSVEEAVSEILNRRKI